MKIALLGYGRMGKTIERIAVERGHQIVLKVDIGNWDQVTDAQLREADVAIDFSAPSVAVGNYKWCFDNGVTVVSGTTGWLERWKEVVEYCAEKECGFFYASNFSVGVNLFFQLNAYLARLMSGLTITKSTLRRRTIFINWMLPVVRRLLWHRVFWIIIRRIKRGNLYMKFHCPKTLFLSQPSEKEKFLEYIRYFINRRSTRFRFAIRLFPGKVFPMELCWLLNLCRGKREYWG